MRLTFWFLKVKDLIPSKEERKGNETRKNQRRTAKADPLHDSTIPITEMADETGVVIEWLQKSDSQPGPQFPFVDSYAGLSV